MNRKNNKKYNMMVFFFSLIKYAIIQGSGENEIKTMQELVNFLVESKIMRHLKNNKIFLQKES